MPASARPQSDAGVGASEIVSTPAPEETSPSDVAAYIAEISGSLATLARTADLTTLAYLLDVATAEATSQDRTRSVKARQGDGIRP